jgi:hypothetical protein
MTAEEAEYVVSLQAHVMTAEQEILHLMTMLADEQSTIVKVVLPPCGRCAHYEERCVYDADIP